jgi:hypothetical protein
MKKINLISLFIVIVFFGHGQSFLSSPVPYDFGSTKFDQGNNDERIFLYGSTSLNTTGDLVSEIQGSGKLLANLRIKKHDEQHKGIDLIFGFNILKLNPKGIEKDSFDLVTLMFPETGNSGLLIAPVWHWYLSKKDNEINRMSSEFSFSLRQNKVEGVYILNMSGDTLGGSENISFSALNYNITPIKYSWFYQPSEELRYEFCISGYINIFNIPNEDVVSINKIFSADNPLFKTTTKSFIYSGGIRFSFALSSLKFFADIRQNFKTTNYNDSNPFKGFLFNAGISTTSLIFKR